MHARGIGVKAVHVRAILPVARLATWRGCGSRRHVESVCQQMPQSSVPTHVDLAADVRERATDAQRRHGWTMFVPGGGVNVNSLGLIGSFTRGVSNVNLLRFPWASTMSTRLT
jgi:hypothetical protein